VSARSSSNANANRNATTRKSPRSGEPNAPATNYGRYSEVFLRPYARITSTRRRGRWPCGIRSAIAAGYCIDRPLYIRRPHLRTCLISGCENIYPSESKARESSILHASRMLAEAVRGRHPDETDGAKRSIDDRVIKQRGKQPRFRFTSTSPAKRQSPSSRLGFYRDARFHLAAPGAAQSRLGHEPCAAQSLLITIGLDKDSRGNYFAVDPGASLDPQRRGSRLARWRRAFVTATPCGLMEVGRPPRHRDGLRVGTWYYCHIDSHVLPGAPSVSILSNWHGYGRNICFSAAWG